MASIKKIKEHPGNTAFLYDLKLCREVMIWVPKTGVYIKIRKSEILKYAESKSIKYEVTSEIFVQKRRSMVIL
jgi:hypothetical protein